MNTSSALNVQTGETSISFFSDFEITSGSPAFTQIIRECFGSEQPITKTYSEPASKNSKNRAKRARKKSKN